MARKSNTTMDALMLVGGGVVGAGLALLLAPAVRQEKPQGSRPFWQNGGQKERQSYPQLHR